MLTSLRIHSKLCGWEGEVAQQRARRRVAFFYFWFLVLKVVIDWPED